MDFKRTLVYALTFAVGFLLWEQWQKDYPNKQVAQQTEQSAQFDQKANNGYLPSRITNGEEKTQSTGKLASNNPFKTSNLISVQTDVLNVNIDLAHGDLVDASLSKYPESLQEKNKPFSLLSSSPSSLYIAKSNLFTNVGGNYKNLNLAFSTKEHHYRLESGKNQLVVTLNGQTKDGLMVEKHFIFERGSYLVKQDYQLVNDTGAPWSGHINLQLLRSNPQEDKRSLFNVGSFVGASMSDPADRLYRKISFSDIQKQDLNKNVKGGWVAMQQHYFLSAWVPNADSNNQIYTRFVNNDYVIGLVSPLIEVEPGQTVSKESKLYVGPEVTGVLEKIAPGLDLTVDYGWLWFISKFLFFLLSSIHSFVGNWGWSIVLVTVLIKLCFYRLSAKSYRSMAAMRDLQPQIQKLRERFGSDKQKLTQATMELYKKEKVNPLGGCLPILIQIPVFIGLYWVLLESVELRQAPFILWIHDLAAKDPYYVLPILMGASMFLQQKMNPPPPDPTQAKVMAFLPIFFTFLFLSFPSGLVLYWVVNNALSILQQWYITEKYGKSSNKKKGSLSAKQAFSK